MAVKEYGNNEFQQQSPEGQKSSDAFIKLRRNPGVEPSIKIMVLDTIGTLGYSIPQTLIVQKHREKRWADDCLQVIVETDHPASEN